MDRPTKLPRVWLNHVRCCGNIPAVGHASMVPATIGARPDHEVPDSGGEETGAPEGLLFPGSSRIGEASHGVLRGGQQRLFLGVADVRGVVGFLVLPLQEGLVGPDAGAVQAGRCIAPGRIWMQTCTAGEADLLSLLGWLDQSSGEVLDCRA